MLGPGFVAVTHLPQAADHANALVNSDAHRAFTLIELLTVIGIIAILAGISFGVLRGIKQQAAAARTRSELGLLTQALENYRQLYGNYPETPTPATPERLYQALNGKLGPTGVELTGHRFISSDQFTLANEDRAHDDRADNFLIDPWGSAYRYVYCRPITSSEKGYVLYSVGADRIDGMAPSPEDGSFDPNIPGNRDNIYAGP